MTRLVKFSYSLPKNFLDDCATFKHFLVDQVTHYKLPEIKFFYKIRISNNSVLFNFFNVVRESCIAEYNYLKYQNGLSFFIKFIFPKINFNNKRFLVITDEWTSNYYHWHLHALPRLQTFKEAGLLDDSLLFLPKKYRNYSFAIPSLEKFGVDARRIIFLPGKSNLKTKECALALFAPNFPDLVCKIKSVLTANIKSFFIDFGEKIYISRKKQKLRNIENNSEFLALVEKYGFREICLEDHSYEEQIYIMSKARYVIAPHGAGITNILFMQGNSSLLELASNQTADKFNHDYYKLASNTDIKYFYQECEMANSSQVKDFHHANLVVDLLACENNLKTMLGIS